MLKKEYYFIFICVHHLAGMPTDTLKMYKISEITVKESKAINFIPGSKYEVLDSIILNRFKNSTLADILSQNNFLMVKSYSPGNLATIGMRGTGASHTAILWNGFNIQSAMNGIWDLNLVPVNFVNQVNMQFGGGGALIGSGAMGGSINLNNIPIFNHGFTAGVNQSIGSFNNYQGNAHMEISKTRWISSLKFFYKDAKNDFPYINSDLQKETQQNAKINFLGLLNENYFKINANQTINLRYWYQIADRQLPPNILSGRQQDQSHRITSEWQKTGKNILLIAKMAFFNEKIDFSTPQIQLLSNEASTFITELETKFRLDMRQNISIGINNTYNIAQGNNLPYLANTNRLAAFGSYKFQPIHQKFALCISVRQQLSDAVLNPITPGIGIEGNIYKKILHLKSNVNRTYRIPTFNDLYWKQRGATGNIGLQPEEGWSQDVGIYSTILVKNLVFDMSLTVFNSNINNWIYWNTIANGMLMPENIQAVWSRGVEITGNCQIPINKNWNIALKANYDITQATIVRSNQVSYIGKQLIYVPYEKAFGNITVQFKKLKINYNQVLTGFRFTQEDNKDFLPAFSLGNIQLNYDIKMQNFTTNIFCQLNNIYSQNYEVLAGRPMPLFNFQAGLAIQFNKPKMP